MIEQKACLHDRYLYVNDNLLEPAIFIFETLILDTTGKQCMCQKTEK